MALKVIICHLFFNLSLKHNKNYAAYFFFYAGIIIMIQKKTILALLLTIPGTVFASDFDLGNYRVEKKPWGCIIKLPDEQPVIKRIQAQLHIPRGVGRKGFGWANFSRWKQKTTESAQGVQFQGSGVFKKNLDVGGIKITANIELKYQIFCARTGELDLCYTFINKGETLLVQPYVNADPAFQLLKKQSWRLEKEQQQVQEGVWGEKAVHGLKSVIYRGGPPKELRIRKAVLFTTLGKPITYEMAPGIHLRLSGAGYVTLFHFSHFSRISSIFPFIWKEFSAKTTFSIRATIHLPVAPDSAPPQRADTTTSTKIKPAANDDIIQNEIHPRNAAQEEREKALRPVIKNGTFYRNGKPVYMIGPWLDRHYFDGNKQIPVPAYQNDPAYNRHFNYEIAKHKGFNCCHPQLSPRYTIHKLNPRNTILREKWRMDNFKYHRTFIQRLRDLPIVADYAALGWYFKPDQTGFPKEMYMYTTRWHGFVPFCLEHPESMKILKEYWRDGVRQMLNNGANPWIYELFNEPAYDCRCPYNTKAFIKLMKEKYTTIARANARWGTSFASFDHAVKSTVFENNPGLAVDWYKFIEDRWCTILKLGRATIRELDKRKHVYFSCQRAIAQSFLTTSHGFDEYKIARTLDVVNTEGGISFSLGTLPKNNDPMEQHQTSCMQMHLDLARAAAEDKPIIDTEQSTKRYDENHMRIASRKSDLNLMLWNEAIHGASCTQIYTWTKRSWEWKPYNLDGAAKFVNGPNRAWAHASLLNPYCYPKDTLDGIKTFKQEIESLAEIVMPRPRIKGMIALLVSNPSRRHTGDIHSVFADCYNAAVMTHYPMDLLFEEQLNKGFAQKYRAIIIPTAPYVYQTTIPALRKYVEQGGILIMHGMDLAYDEYGRPIDPKDITALTGITSRHQLDMPVADRLSLPMATGYPSECKIKLTVKTTVADAREFATSSKKVPQIICRHLGSGTVYHLSFEAKGLYFAGIIASLLTDAGIHQPFTIRRPDGSLLNKVEAQVINRGDTRLYYFVDWCRVSELGVLVIHDLPQGNWSITDPTTHTLLLAPTGAKTWTTGDMAKGVNLFLPGEERTILLITRKSPLPIKSEITQENIRDTFSERHLQDQASEAALQKRREKANKLYRKRNSYPDVNHDKIFFIDISRQCNMAFADEIDGDKKGGAFDQGKNDLRSFPVGERIFCNIPFNIIDPARNHGKSIIVLKGKARQYFPEKAAGIPVQSKARRLYFLHTVAWDSGKFCYMIRFSDGSKQQINIRSGHEVGGWWHPKANKAPDAKLAWKGKNGMGVTVGVFCYAWNNPYPDKTITAIDVISYNMNFVPAVIAITGEK